MINIAQARTGLTKIVTEHVPQIKAVYPRAIDDPVISTPAVVLSALVTVECDIDSTACSQLRSDQLDISMAVLVARNGTAEEAVQIELETAWTACLDALRRHIDSKALSEVGYYRRVMTVEPGAYTIAGIEYPAQVITIRFEG